MRYSEENINENLSIDIFHVNRSKHLENNISGEIKSGQDKTRLVEFPHQISVTTISMSK